MNRFVAIDEFAKGVAEITRRNAPKGEKARRRYFDAISTMFFYGMVR